MGRGAAHSAGVEGCTADWAGVALPGAAPAGVQGLDSCGLGCVGKQPQGEVLFADSDGPQAIAGGVEELGPALGCDRAGAGTDSGGGFMMSEWLTRIRFFFLR